MIGLCRVIVALINLMDWKYDSTEAACNISTHYSTNYVFTYIHMPEESCCTLRMQNLKRKKKKTTLTTEGISYHGLSLVLFRLGHGEMDFEIKLVY